MISGLCIVFERDKIGLAGSWGKGRGSRSGQSGEHLLHEQQCAMPGTYNTLDEGFPQRLVQKRPEQGQSAGQQGGISRGLWQPHGEAVHGAVPPLVVDAPSQQEANVDAFHVSDVLQMVVQLHAVPISLPTADKKNQ